MVCVLIDQLRRDAADLWFGRLKRLAARGVVFEEMRSAAPWTYPSVISLMSGLYPQQHGADGHLLLDVLTTFDRRVPLLHRVLKRAGFRTAAFVTNPFLHRWNPFHEGFDHFDAHFVGSEGNRRGDDSIWIPESMFAGAVNQAIIEHFRRRRRSAPEFTYIHYIDVHGPWEHAPFTGSYEAAVRFIDERVADIHAFFMQRYDGDLLFFVTSDHGMALADDEEIGSGRPWRKSKLSVHDFNLRIPFLVLPGRRVPEARIPGPCSNVDFVPTLLDWLRIPPPRGLPGASLLRAIRGEETLPASRPIYARVSAFKGYSDCIVHRDRKYMRFFDLADGSVTARHTFDLRSDPREALSLGEDFGEAEPLIQKAAGVNGRAYVARLDGPSPELRRRLGALGYLQ